MGTVQILALQLVFLFGGVSGAQGADLAKSDKPVIRTRDQLPQYSYAIASANTAELMNDDKQIQVLSEKLQIDTQSTLDNFSIEDRATLRERVAMLRDIAILKRDYRLVLTYDEKLRQLSDKPAEKLIAGLREDALAKVMLENGKPEDHRQEYLKLIRNAVDQMPWAVVGDGLIGLKGRLEIFNTAVAMGALQGDIDPVIQQTKSLSWDNASELIGRRVWITVLMPYREETARALGDYVGTHRILKPDIWPARELTLDSKIKTAPVVVAIWDTGVDIKQFPNRLYTNAAEKLNGLDDDHNGFVDDIHGIAFNIRGEAQTDLMYPLDARYPNQESELRELNVGIQDAIVEGINTPAADSFRARLGAISAEQLQPLREAINSYASYAHGTHVAGIAMAGNPAARLLTARLEWDDFLSKREPETPDLIHRRAVGWQRVVEYFKAHQVRVVNMSWNDSAGDIQKTLDGNGVGKSAEERKAMAQASFLDERKMLTEAFRLAPSILFVCSAGNDDADVGFRGAIPSDIDLPNVVVVGAVDQAGDEADFTSYGDRVRIYGNGFQVESVVPGGTRMRLSGTSMAAPQVSNLAAKLIAVDPRLTPEKTLRLILDGADRSPDGKRLLLNPKRSMDLLKKMTDSQ